MSDAALPAVTSLTGWNVGVTPYGTLEVLLVLADKREARAWAMWLADRKPGKPIPEATTNSENG